MNLPLNMHNRTSRWLGILTYSPCWRFCSQQDHTTSFLYLWYCNVRPKTACSKSSPQLLQKKVTGNSMFEGPFCVWLGSLWLEPVDEPEGPLSRNLVSQMLAEVIVRAVLTPYCQNFWNPQDQWGVDVKDRKQKAWWEAKNTRMGSFLYIVWTKIFFVSMSAYP